jgi:hypothetical protein
MKNKQWTIVLLALSISSVSFAGNDKNKPVNININPSVAHHVSTHGHDTRLEGLRDQAMSQAEKHAKAKDQSYVAAAPDPNNPNYWKEKNTENDASASVQATQRTLLDEQQLQRQTVGLEKILSQLNRSGSKVKFTSIRFNTKKVKTSSDNGLGKHQGNLEKSAIALPGTLWYATLSLGADSYTPGPVTATIQEGPLAGAKALGTFQVAPDGEHIILTFHVLSFHGRTYPVSAVAVDPHTKISAITGDIDHHILARYILPGAANFLEKVSQALTSQEGSVVTNPASTVITGPSLSTAQLGLIGMGGATQSFAKATNPTGVLRLPEVKIAVGQSIGFLLTKPIS